ncbi:hypothetical protein X736_33030 [Mesorhizobium sp. L2C089B000]|nr:hypothetical protein X736_33030 [Mesorhizobium sp. L2C089B000]
MRKPIMSARLWTTWSGQRQHAAVETGDDGLAAD